VAIPMKWISLVATPFVWLLSHSTGLLMKVLRLDRGQADQVTEEEIRMLVAESHEQGVIDVGERNMINRVLRLGDRSSAGLMTPRTRIVWLDASASFEENLEVMRETPFARYPVYRGGDSDVAGILEAKTLLDELGKDLPELFREARLQNGIAFIDECEQLCGVDSEELPQLLVELERTDGEARRTAGSSRPIARASAIVRVGADPKPASLYVRKRGEGELAVRAEFPGAIVVRPAVMSL